MEAEIIIIIIIIAITLVLGMWLLTEKDKA